MNSITFDDRFAVCNLENTHTLARLIMLDVSPKMPFFRVLSDARKGICENELVTFVVLANRCPPYDRQAYIDIWI